MVGFVGCDNNFHDTRWTGLYRSVDENGRAKGEEREKDYRDKRILRVNTVASSKRFQAPYKF